jgi:hypothetical protein
MDEVMKDETVLDPSRRICWPATPPIPSVEGSERASVPGPILLRSDNHARLFRHRA